MPVYTGQPVPASCAVTVMNNLLVAGPNLLASSVNVNASCAITVTGMAFNLENSSGTLNAASAVAYKNTLLNFVASTGFIFNLNNSSGLNYSNAILQATSTIDSLMQQAKLGLQVSS